MIPDPKTPTRETMSEPVLGGSYLEGGELLHRTEDGAGPPPRDSDRTEEV